MDCRSFAPLIVLLASVPAAAQTAQDPPPAPDPVVISGPAEVVDGDTLKIDGVRIRLFGIDAPEMAAWPWGARARFALEDLTDGKTVTCLQRDTDRYDRPVATCATEHTPDLAEALIAGGLAITYRRFTAGTELHAPYLAAEGAARAGGLGPWAHASARNRAHWLERYQSGLGALLGLLALTSVAFYNARQARKRDDLDRASDARAVAAELASELMNVRLSLVAACVKATQHAEEYAKDGWGSMKERRPRFEIYRANLGRIGSLGPQLAGDVASLASAVHSLWNSADEGFEDATDVDDWAKKMDFQYWKADALAHRLAALADVEIELFDTAHEEAVATRGPRSDDEPGGKAHGNRQSENGTSSS